MKKRLPIAGRLGPEAIAAAAEGEVVAALAAGSAAGEVASDAHAWLDDVLDRARAMFPPSAASACEEGCAFCCHLKVIATPAECIRLAKHLVEALDATRYAALVARVDAAWARSRGATAEARAALRMPCPVLEDGRCAGYEARPLHCAGANSFSREACQAAFVDPSGDAAIPHYPAQRLGADAITAGISRGLFRAKKDGRILELVAALRVLLHDDTAGVRWARGERALEEAVDREMEAMLRARPQS